MGTLKSVIFKQWDTNIWGRKTVKQLWFFPGIFSLSGRILILGVLKLTISYVYSRYTFTFYHSTFKMSKRIHKFKISRKIGNRNPCSSRDGPIKSLVRHNSKRAGFVSPQDFRIRKSSPRVWGSPLSSPRLKLN